MTMRGMSLSPFIGPCLESFDFLALVSFVRGGKEGKQRGNRQGLNPGKLRGGEGKSGMVKLYDITMLWNTVRGFSPSVNLFYANG